MSRSARRLKGFTLIELMVVISIVAILAALGTVSYSTAQKKARDAKRRADMQAVASAFEQYYSNNDNVYDDTSTTCATMAADGVTLPAGLPSDPKNSGTYVYNWSCPDSTQFCVCAHVETTGKGNSPNNACGFTGAGSKDYYCVRNSQ